jgi:hypothetical protein
MPAALVGTGMEACARNITCASGIDTRSFCLYSPGL